VLGSGSLLDGVASVALSPTLAVGTHTLAAVYAGNEAFAPSRGSVTVTVKKAVTKIRARTKDKNYAFRADVKVKVRVTAAGFTPRGQVKITEAGRLVGRGKLEHGKTIITITKDLKAGRHDLLVEYRGTAITVPCKRTIHLYVLH
jgi:hypothetical protein